MTHQDTENISMDSVVLMESKEELLRSHASSPVNQPSNADLMKIMLEINANTAVNNKFKAAATKRLNVLVLEQRAEKSDKRIEILESFGELNSGNAHAPSSANDWLDKRKLRNNVSIVGIPPSQSEKAANVVVDLCAVFGIVISAGVSCGTRQIQHDDS